jgi:4-carboxymuconolactone decarboxylase
MLDLQSPTPPGAIARGLAVASALGALGDEARLAAHCDAWFAAGLPPAVLGEGMFQLYLFCGYPRALNALRVFREREAAAGLPPAADLGDDPSREAAQARGAALCRRVYGARYDALLRHVQTLHPTLARLMVEEGYGRVLGRPGMEPVWREIATVGALVPLGVAPQVRAHLRGALNLGATLAALRTVLHDVEPCAAPAHAATAWALLRELEAR